MSEKHQTFFLWTSKIATLLAMLFAAVAAFTGWPARIIQYSAAIATLLGIVARWCEQQLPSVAERKAEAELNKPSASGPVAGLVFIVGLSMILCSGCASKLATGYRSLVIAERLGETTAEALAAGITLKASTCKATSSTKADFDKCFAQAKQAGETWRDTVKPALNTALEATWGVLETAYKAKAKEASWLEKLKPGLCSLSKMILEWEPFLNDKAPGLTAQVRLVEGLVCP